MDNVKSFMKKEGKYETTEYRQRGRREKEILIF